MNSLGNKQIIAINLQKYMEINGKDRNDISKALDVPYTTVSDWVNGKTYPRIDKIEMLAQLFNVKKADLVEEKPNETDAVYYLNNETAEIAQEIYQQDKVVFDAYRSAYKDRLIAYAQKLMDLEKMEKGDLE